MKIPQNTIDLVQSCNLYSSMIQKALSSLCMVEVNKDLDSIAESVTQLESQENLYFSILFTGQIYGEFLIGLNKSTAIKIYGLECPIGEEDKVFNENRADIIDLFKEIVNIAAGTTVGQFKEKFPELSITPPKAIEGNISLSSYDIFKTQLHHVSGILSCYIYVDYMRLEVSEALKHNQEKLKQEKEQQEELKRLNKAKSEFLANMSHELRTPLNGMIGMLDILKPSIVSPIQSEQFNIIYQSGEFLLSLISDILEFSKIESGKMELEIKAFDLRLAIENVAENLATVVLQKNLSFNFQINPEISGMFLGDVIRLKQVIVNLVGNSVKFTPTGSITLIVDYDINKNIIIKVIDTGIGIPADKIDKVFASFTQADVSDNRKYGGTGLGLTITKSIIEAMSGEIYLKSQEAKGTEFTIQLPLKKAIEAEVIIKDSFKKLKESDCIAMIIENEFLQETLTKYINYMYENNSETITVIDAQESKSDCLINQKILITEFILWKRMNPELQKNIINLANTGDIYIVFAVLPKDHTHFQELQNELPTSSFYFLNLPLTMTRLQSIIQDRPSIKKAQEKKSSVNASDELDSKKHTETRKILVVEDNKVNQLVITTMLKKLGYNVSLTDDGQQCVNLLDSGEKFDMILMDCQMPVMNGYEATQAIRDREKGTNQHIPIIALTANAFKETKEECFECGMDDFSTKPIKFEELKEILKRVKEKFTN